MKSKQRYKEVKQAVKRHGKFKDDPWERIGSLALSTIADKTLPNVMIGVLITTQIEYMGGAIPQRVRNLAIIATIATILFHGIADEIATSLKALSEEVSENEQTNRHYE